MAFADVNACMCAVLTYLLPEWTSCINGSAEWNESSPPPPPSLLLTLCSTVALLKNNNMTPMIYARSENNEEPSKINLFQTRWEQHQIICNVRCYYYYHQLTIYFIWLPPPPTPPPPRGRYNSGLQTISGSLSLASGAGTNGHLKHFVSSVLDWKLITKVFNQRYSA